jgi:hypothetical protein
MDDPMVRAALSILGTVLADMLAGWTRKVMDGWRRGVN